MQSAQFTDVLKTATAAKPVTVDDLKVHAYIHLVDDDTYLGTLIETAARHISKNIRQALINESRVVTFDRPPISNQDEWWDGVRQGAMGMFDQRALELPIYPLVSITSIKYWTISDTEQTFNSSQYFADTSRQPGRAVLTEGSTWPTDMRTHSSLSIEYVAGYGDDDTNIPPDIKHSLYIMCKDLYDNRGSGPMNMESAVIKNQVAHLVSVYKAMRI